MLFSLAKSGSDGLQRVKLYFTRYTCPVDSNLSKYISQVIVST